MAVKLAESKQNWLGLSGDTKPTSAPIASTFYETDTGKHYIWNGSTWVQYANNIYTANVYPIADNTYALGSAALSYREVHVETFVYATSVVGNWSPSAASTYSLGTTALEWQGLYLGDDVGVFIGLDQDSVLYHRTATLAADTALTGVLIGTPVTPALAANSLIVSNITADGDILIAGNDGGHSRVALYFDSSTPDTYLYNVGGTWTAGATTWTIPAVTLGGTVTGGNQTVNNLGHIGLGDNAASTLYGLYYSEVYALADNNSRGGAYAATAAYKTSAVFTGTTDGFYVDAGITASNTQNWTDAIGLKGIWAAVSLATGTGATSTVTGAACFYAEAAVGGAANDMVLTNLYGLYVPAQTLIGNSKLTNDYGIYIGSQAGGATLNYAIYTNAGLVHFGDSVDLVDDKLFRLGATFNQVMLNCSAGLAADTALAGVIVGTPDTSAIVANSLIISNITADGDILIAVNDGGASKQMIFLDGSTGVTHLGKPGTPVYATATGDVYAAGKFEVGGASKFLGNINLPDGVTIVLGTGSDARIRWETADANAHATTLTMTPGDATSVPVFVIGNTNIQNADLGFFNGITQPRVVVIDTDLDSWVGIGFNADDIASLFVGGVGTALAVPMDLTFNSGTVSNARIKTVAVTKAHGSDLFDAAALTDSVVIWQQPAGSVLLSVKMKMTEQFVAASMTDLDVTMGLAGDVDGLLVQAMNMTSDAAGSAYTTRGAYWNEAAGMGFLNKDAATDWIAYATAVGANLSTTSAGSVTFYITYLDIP